jgi:hypothetical protein
MISSLGLCFFLLSHSAVFGFSAEFQEQRMTTLAALA